MKIAFCGAHGTGKTTLMELCFNSPFFDDYKRIYSVSRQLPKGWKDKRHQAYVNSSYLLQHFLYKNFISARSFFDAWAYSRVNCGLTFYERRFKLGLRLIKYDYLYYIPPEIELHNDNYRPLDKNYQLAIDREIKYLLNKYDINYYTITGTIDARHTLISSYQ